MQRALSCLKHIWHFLNVLFLNFPHPFNSRKQVYSSAARLLWSFTQNSLNCTLLMFLEFFPVYLDRSLSALSWLTVKKSGICLSHRSLLKSFTYWAQIKRGHLVNYLCREPAATEIEQPEQAPKRILTFGLTLCWVCCANQKQRQVLSAKLAAS